MTYKGFFTAIAITVSIFACQKKTQSNTVDIYNSLQPNNEAEITLIEKLNDPKAYAYRSPNGAIYRAYYLIDQTDKKVIVQSPEHIFILPQKETWAKGALYEKNTVLWEAQDNQIRFNSGHTEEILYQISPIVKNYASETEQIKITATFENDKNYVLLERKDLRNVKLPQCEINLPKIKYCNDTVTWVEEKENASLTVKGITSTFKLRN